MGSAQEPHLNRARLRFANTGSNGVGCMSNAPRQALEGIRVLDLARVVAGPLAAQILGDLGAEVIKVERPKVGDDVRAYASQGHFAAWNRNKRSITVDLSRPEGQEIVRKLAAKADVLVENYIPGTMKRFGLDYERLAKDNPRLVYCSVSGFGQTGPYSGRGGMDHIFQARGGLMSVIEVPRGQPGEGPVMTGVTVTDCATGRDAGCAILAALIERDRSGLGQHIDIALIDSAMALMSHCAQDYLLSGESPTSEASKQTRTGWSGFLECADGKVFALGSRNPWFEALCRVLGIPDVLKDPRFATPQARFGYKPEITAMLAPRAKAWKKAELAEALAREGVLAAPVNNTEEAFADAAVKVRGAAVPLPAAYDKDLRVVKSPLGLARTPPTYRRPPPQLGEHTEEVLEQELELGAAEIAKLRAAAAI
jgi:crotonobetainyl-CoA:carnitine CoA-transferase CaiB-like acyl-CoA transferase